jgi:arylsulfatase A-like enzyme
MPTLLGMMGLKVPGEAEGMDMSELVISGEGDEPEYAFMQGMGHTYLWLDGYEWRAVRDKQYTYARYLKDGKELLFDNLNDPLQATNLVDNQEYSEKLMELRSQMTEKMAELNDQFMPCTWYRDHWTEGRVIKASARGTF